MHQPAGVHRAEHQGRGLRRGAGELEGRVLRVRHGRERVDHRGGAEHGDAEPGGGVLPGRVPEDDRRRRQGRRRHHRLRRVQGDDDDGVAP